MSRFGCRVLLKNLCFTKESVILLVNKKLYYHPVAIVYGTNSLINTIKINNITLTFGVNEYGVALAIYENAYYLHLGLDKLMLVSCIAKIGEDMMLEVIKGRTIQYCIPIGVNLKRILSTDIFGVCMQMFRLLKSG